MALWTRSNHQWTPKSQKVKEARRQCTHLSTCHIPPPYREDDRCIDRQHSGNLHGTYSTQRNKQTRSSTPKMQPRKSRRVPAHSLEFHVSRLQVTISNILRNNTRERESEIKFVRRFWIWEFPCEVGLVPEFVCPCARIFRPPPGRLVPPFSEEPRIHLPIHPHACAPWFPFPVLFHVDGGRDGDAQHSPGDGRKQKEGATQTHTEQRATKDDFVMFFIQSFSSQF